jgi:hypothetical protein
MTLQLAAVQDWYCPACGQTDRTREAKPHSRFHPCPRMHGLTTPMLPKGTRAKLEAVERQDYVGNELVRLDDRGRPVMSIVTTRDNGQDVTVFAPTATGRHERID